MRTPRPWYIYGCCGALWYHIDAAARGLDRTFADLSSYWLMRHLMLSEPGSNATPSVRCFSSCGVRR